MPWYFFAILTPFLYSFNNLFDKYVVSNKIKNPINLTVFNAFISSAIGIIIFCLKGFPLLPLLPTIAILASGIFLILYLIPYFKALSLDEASRVVPIFQIIPVFILIFSFILLNETLSLKQIVGMIVVIVASIGLMINKLDSGLFKPRPALWLMLVSSAMYALLNVLFRFVVVKYDYWIVLSYQFIGSGIGALFLCLFFTNKKQLRKDFSIFKKLSLFFLGSSSISVLANISETFAISLVPVAFVSIFSGLQPVFVLTLGVLLTVFFPKIIKEDVSKSTLKQKIIAIGLIFVGLCIVYF